jgi:hypothetical protein
MRASTSGEGMLTMPDIGRLRSRLARWNLSQIYVPTWYNMLNMALPIAAGIRIGLLDVWWSLLTYMDDLAPHSDPA